MINILSWTTKKHQKILYRPLNSKLKKIQGLFKDLHKNLRTFQGKMEFKDFLRPSSKIQGLFKTVRTLLIGGGGRAGASEGRVMQKELDPWGGSTLT